MASARPRAAAAWSRPCPGLEHTATRSGSRRRCPTRTSRWPSARRRLASTSSWTAPTYRIRLVVTRSRGLRRVLQRGREPDAVVHPALPLGPLERPGHPPGGARRLGGGLLHGQPALRRGGQRGGRGRPRRGGDAPRLPPVHGARDHPAAAPGRVPALLRAHPVEPAGRLAGPAAGHPRGDLRGMLANDIIAFHTRSYGRNFLLCCRELFDLGSTTSRPRALRGPRRMGALLPAPDLRRDVHKSAQRPGRPRVRARDPSPPARAPDPARGPRGPLEEHPARLHGVRPVPRAASGVPRARHVLRPPDPSRQDVPEYAEYLESIQALVAVVNHRHGTTDWMPIDLRLRENLEEAISAYKHYDLLMVNAIFDGMNLIAKEGPARQRAQRGVDPRARTPAPTRSSRSSRCRSTPSTSRSRPTRSTAR